MAAFAVCLVLLVAAVAALWSIREALEHRQVAATAVDLQLAAHTVAAADSLASAGVDSAFSDLPSAVDRLRDEHDVALQTFEPAERLRAQQLLQEIAGCGILLLDADAEGHPAHGHDELQDLLGIASVRARSEASIAERRAMWALLLGGLAAGVAGWLLLRARANEVRLRQNLYQQANTDLLTGLPNRRALDRVLSRARSEMETTGRPVALISLDLDAFKDINDTLGHHAGDELLTRVADRLCRARRASDVLLRLGSDEFAVVLVSVDEPTDASAAANRYLQVLEAPFQIKIDRSLLLTLTEMREQAVGDSSDPCAIMAAIVSIAGIFNAPVICEGVETEQQRASLQASGITHLQGYLAGRPTPPEEIVLPSPGSVLTSR